jgi:MFS family permease
MRAWCGPGRAWQIRLAARAARHLSSVSRLRRSLSASTLEGAFAEVFVACSSGAVLTGWALHLGCSTMEVGLLGALPFLSQAVQLPSAWLTATMGRRRIAIAAITASRLAFLPLAALPFIPLAPPSARLLLLAVAASSAALGVAGSNAWTAWMGELVPERLRGRYFGTRTAVCTLGACLAGLGAGFLLDRAGGDRAGLALAGLAVAAAAVGLVTGALLARQHEPAAPAAPPPGLAALLRPLADPAARAILAYQVAWNASVGLGAGFFALHLLGDLGLAFSVLALHGAGTAAARVLAAPLCGGAIDRVGARPVLAACSFAVGLTPLLWIAAAPGRLWPVALDALVGGAAWGGHQLASFALPLAVAPRQERPFYVAAFSAAGGLAFAAAAAAGGALAGALPSRFALFGRSTHALEVLFVLSAAGRLLAAPLALRIRERGAGSVTDLQELARAAVASVPGRVAALLRTV